MIVKLDSWSRDESISRFCDRLLTYDGTKRKSTPQRCLITLSGKTLAAIGLENGKPVVEFRPREEDYAEAHGSTFVRPHPLQQMARDGWLQGRPENNKELDYAIGWIESVMKP